jgi:hypothetical protein
MKKDLSETGWKGTEWSPMQQDSAHFGGICFSTVMEDSGSIKGRNFSTT